jgi:hypothetical protein
VNSCDTTVKLDDENGVLQDVTGSSSAVDQEFIQNVGDGLRTFGTDFPVRAACGRDGNVTWRVVYSQADNESLYMLLDWYFNHPKTARTFQVSIPDDTPGSDRYSFEMLLANLRIPDEAGNPDPIIVEAALRPTGAFTWAVVGS